VLGTTSAAERLVVVEELVAEQHELLEARLRLGDPGGDDDAWNAD
jgi:hypothetical protein